ncbi:MAG: hypothetical protein WCK02_02635 [Bacteroidota bacterium]
MFKSINLLFVLIISSISVFSQSTESNYLERGILYRYEKSGGLQIHTQGFGMHYRTGKHLTGYSKTTLEFDLVGMKHPKEVKSVSSLYVDAKSFVYGKLNTLTILRTGLGVQKIINSKGRGIKSAVEVRYFYFLGGSLGFAKPVYLYIVKGFTSNYKIITATEKYNPQIHYPENIFGRASFVNGIDEIKIHPGGYAKFGLSFDYAAYEEEVKSIEIGAILDAYPKSIPIMATKTNNNLFLTFYMSFNIGKRFNK